MDNELNNLFAEINNIEMKPTNEYLEDLLKCKGLNKLDVMKRANINKNYGYQIFNGTRNPSRTKVLMLGAGFSLSQSELNEMLAAYGYAALYARSKHDAAVMYGAPKGYTVDMINELLDEFGENRLE